MTSLLLAPYNESIQLGQGFNSFLQSPCIHGAVKVPQDVLDSVQKRSVQPVSQTSQIVSYSSRFVERLSDVVRSMNISAASSIKSGTIQTSGNSLSVDETKFSASDWNAVISVKVINHTTTILTDAEFVPLSETMTLGDAAFFEIYGDCYVSGFIEGGDLHGIVSMKALKESKKTEIESALKGQMNGLNNEFSLSEGLSASNFSGVLSETETSVTVNWTGGGIIKPDNEEWTFESLLRCASSFPSRVAACPQRTWAVLTKYNKNRSFVKWNAVAKINVPRFSAARLYTSDLLDQYMEFKHNIEKIQEIIAAPGRYKPSPSKTAIPVDIEALVEERRGMRDEMKKISRIIDELNSDPAKHYTTDIRSPEVWAAQMPIPKDGTSTIGDVDVEALWKGLPIRDEAPDIVVPDALALLSTTEKNFMRLPSNRSLYREFRFDQPQGVDSAYNSFNTAVDLVAKGRSKLWPTRFEFRMTVYNNGPTILKQIVITFEGGLLLKHPPEDFNSASFSASGKADVSSAEKINRICLGKGASVGISFVQAFTPKNPNVAVVTTGADTGKIDLLAPAGRTGLKGFYGQYSDAVITKLAPIWG